MPQPAHPIRPVPAPSVRPWAGTRLGGAGEQVGELWLAGPDSVVTTDHGDRTLDALAAELGEALVGSSGMKLLGPRFPLIVKVIDAGDWLSLQVHPDDALARDLYGPEALGKVEAWLVIDADAAGLLVTGPAADMDEELLRETIAAGTASHRQCHHRSTVPGETLLIRAGTMHAIGPGAFVYEIEQPSDLTFRISDWARPTGRTLHVAEALRALRPALRAETAGSGFRLDGGALEVSEFRLELPDLAAPVDRHPGGRSCEIVTAIRGMLRVTGDGWSETLAPYETLVVPAAVEAYEIAGPADGIACVGSLP